jgi:hypothetical protein
MITQWVCEVKARIAPFISILCKRLNFPCAYLIKHYATKVYGRVEVYIHAFFTSALGEVEWSASQPSRFTLRERPSSIHGIGGSMGPGVGLDAVKKMEVSCPAGNPTPLSHPCSPCLLLYQLSSLFISI